MSARAIRDDGSFPQQVAGVVGDVAAILVVVGEHAHGHDAARRVDQPRVGAGGADRPST